MDVFRADTQQLAGEDEGVEARLVDEERLLRPAKGVNDLFSPFVLHLHMVSDGLRMSVPQHQWMKVACLLSLKPVSQIATVIDRTTY